MSPVISKVEIAICTWNRAPLLKQTLASVNRLRIPGSTILSVIIVDNNSDDATPDVIDQFVASTESKISVIPRREPNQGHTFSRNTAIDAATGDLILWTDDDVLLAPDWVERYVVAVERDPQAVFWGSVIKPVFPAGRPAWIDDHWDILQGCFAGRDLGPEPIELNPTRLPYGANFAIRTEVQKKYRFSHDLGRRGNEVLGEDEIDLFRRLLKEGFQGSWVPGAVVEHQIPPERATEAYVYNYFLGQGRALVSKGEPWHHDWAKLKLESRSEYAKYKLKRLFASSQIWVSHLLRSALAQGQFEALKNRQSGGES